VISTEAVHIVNGRAEKSASLPHHSGSHVSKPSRCPQKTTRPPHSVHVFAVKKSRFPASNPRRIHPEYRDEPGITKKLATNNTTPHKTRRPPLSTAKWSVLSF